MSRVTKAALEQSQKDTKFYADLYAKTSRNLGDLASKNWQLTQELAQLKAKNAELALAGLKAAGAVAQGYEQEIARIESEHTQTIDKCAQHAAAMIKQTALATEADTLAKAFKYLADRVTTVNQGE
ncbi:MAG TPA: hypothetical protein VIY48_04340 [Candidatus Paceibacterota bacterium]